jgi:hypothetical protein
MPEFGDVKLSLAWLGDDSMPRRAEDGGVAATMGWEEGRVLLGVALEPRELGLLPTAAGAGLLGGWLPSEFMAQMGGGGSKAVECRDGCVFWAMSRREARSEPLKSFRQCG